MRALENPTAQPDAGENLLKILGVKDANGDYVTTNKLYVLMGSPASPPSSEEWERLFWAVIRNTYGYLNKKQWGLSRTAIEAVAKKTAAGAELPTRAKAFIGWIGIGPSIASTVSSIAFEAIGEHMLKAIKEMKVLANGLQKYAASGMNDTDAANEVNESLKKLTTEVEAVPGLDQTT